MARSIIRADKLEIKQLVIDFSFLEKSLNALQVASKFVEVCRKLDPSMKYCTAASHGRARKGGVQQELP